MEVRLVRRYHVMMVVPLLVLAVLFVPSPARGEPTESLSVSPTRLPFGWADGTAVFAADAIYLIGGTRNTSNSAAITRFSPSSGTFTDEPVSLPSPRFGLSAVWTGAEVLIFGGKSETSDFAETLRFNPTAHAITSGANLTSGRGYSVAIWDGRYAWVFGGYAGFDQVRRDAIRFDPQADTVTAFPAEQLGFATNFAGTWDGTRVTFFGGVFDFAALQFDPTTQRFETPTVTPGGMPQVKAASAAQLGSYAYLFGGWETGAIDRVVRFQTSAARWETSSAKLNRSLAFTATAWTGETAYILGGRTTGFGTDLIQVFASHEVGESTTMLPWVGLVVGAIAIPVLAAIVFWRRRKRVPASDVPAAPPKEET